MNAHLPTLRLRLIFAGGLMGAVVVGADCGGSVEPSTPPVVLVRTNDGVSFPPLEGCVGDELVQPRGDVRLLGQWSGANPGHDLTVSANDTNVFVSVPGSPLLSLSREGGTPLLAGDAQDVSIVIGSWRFSYGPRQPCPLCTHAVLAGPLGQAQVLVEPAGELLNESGVPLSGTGSVILYSYETAKQLRIPGWWDHASGRGGDFPVSHARDCLSLRWAVLRGHSLVWGEAAGATSSPTSGLWCSADPVNVRVHFDSPAGARTVDGKVLATYAAEPETETFLRDATSRTVISAARFRDEYAFFDTIEGFAFLTRENLGLANNLNHVVVVARDHLFVPTVAGGAFQIWRFGLDRKPPGELRGGGRGTPVASFHDKFGAYWLSYDEAATEYLLWVLDFDDLGCPP